jgi:hypothetical protein
MGNTKQEKTKRTLSEKELNTKEYEIIRHQGILTDGDEYPLD